MATPIKVFEDNIAGVDWLVWFASALVSLGVAGALIVNDAFEDLDLDLQELENDLD